MYRVPKKGPDFMRKQLIDEFGIAHAILLPRAFCNLQPDPDFGTAIAAAYNDWLAETWLDRSNPDGCFKGSITAGPPRTRRRRRGRSSAGPDIRTLCR